MLGRGRGGGDGGDARNWDEDGYRSSILMERELSCRTVFRTVFAPSQSPDPETLVVASSDGSIGTYSIASCIAAAAAAKPVQSNRKIDRQYVRNVLLAEPVHNFQAHKGPAYDLKFYGTGEESLLLSCGDDGHVRGWLWTDVLNSEALVNMQGNLLNPILDLVNTQHEGPWGALSPIPENNALAISKQEGSIFTASGDACAYCWDVETCRKKMVFKGHSDYLHCVAVRQSSNQIITGSEDGTARLWDCRSGICTRVLYPEKGWKLNEPSSVSCVALDASESWLTCGTGKSLSVWSLLSCERIFSTDTDAPIQDLLFDDNQILAVGSKPILTRLNINGEILSEIQCAPQSAFSVSLHHSGVAAVGGYGGLVDIISPFGSHLCTWCCQGLCQSL